MQLTAFYRWNIRAASIYCNDLVKDKAKLSKVNQNLNRRAQQPPDELESAYCRHRPIRCANSNGENSE
jgi:hypothetical protein